MDRYTLTEEKMREKIRIQVAAKLAPWRLKVPAGWTPRTAFDRHLAKLMGRK